MDYDCIIVGTGPAGIFAALEITDANPGARVLMMERGRDIGERERKEVFAGWGGAGTFSDGKLNLSREVGGFLGDYMTPEALDDLIKYTDSVYQRYGATCELKVGGGAEVASLEEDAARAGLKLVPFPIRHLGTDRCLSLLENLRAELGGRVEVLFGCEATEVVTTEGRVSGVTVADGRTFGARFVILAPGRSGSGWLHGVARSIGLSTRNNPVDIGVRVELPSSVMRRATDTLHEAKLIYNSKRFDDPVRTFCMNPYGVVVTERHEGFSTVNGHSYSVKKSDNTNFAILVSTTFTEPFDQPNDYGRYIASLANLLGGGILVQRLGDLMHGRRSTRDRIDRGSVRPTLTDATPGDLSFAMPYRYLSDILEMMEALDRFAPGVASPSTLLYGIEVKFYSLRLCLTDELETEIENLFAVGDGAGVTRGIMHASMSGVVAARAIAARLKGEGGGKGTGDRPREDA